MIIEFVHNNKVECKTRYVISKLVKELLDDYRNNEEMCQENTA